MLPHSQKIIAAMPPDVPVIHFVAGNPALLGLAAQAGGQVIGVDWRCDLDRAWRRIGFDRAVQGNLDPLTLLADRDTIGRRVKQLLDSAFAANRDTFSIWVTVWCRRPTRRR